MNDWTGHVYEGEDGQFYQHVNGADPVLMELADGNFAQLRALMELRDVAAELRELDRKNEKEERAEALRGQLRDLHMDYVAACGPLSKPGQHRTKGGPPTGQRVPGALHGSSKSARHGASLLLAHRSAARGAMGAHARKGTPWQRAESRRGRASNRPGSGGAARLPEARREDRPQVLTHSEEPEPCLNLGLVLESAAGNVPLRSSASVGLGGPLRRDRRRLRLLGLPVRRRGRGALGWRLGLVAGLVLPGALGLGLLRRAVRAALACRLLLLLSTLLDVLERPGDRSVRVHLTPGGLDGDLLQACAPPTPRGCPGGTLPGCSGSPDRR
ncbi:hypothetical protein [Streptomyces wuyuanensis]|uniref:hypothetical protein n=1 Tax=Streptomyces wuyuanensis TaxID=1196353 RepID=UPI003711D580